MEDLHRAAASWWLRKVRVVIVRVVIDVSVVKLIDNALIQAAAVCNRSGIVFIDVCHALLVIVVDIDGAVVIHTIVDISVSRINVLGVSIVVVIS